MGPNPKKSTGNLLVGVVRPTGVPTEIKAK